ncbi:hypothetical protein AGDE_12997 [Angomonas deanei]|uniref:Zinc finger C-x8-C-x5-C-x3-H type (And similar)/CCCH-type zinc finger/RNB domain containing protein, putative n=1 Tax=Angomonas deanei TaxID=59799 RepID=A0A7G2CA13_9TRYP|nr:hypothetical protein AGDE_12997 [Angomonas deanei]CAD2216606.1 Zinc finger C-x8-C-x5-C-x3-H type (and similar)/CCCH-type zinc finger/RNB domain containing protein, putative [Angomonas deanei]|eukprot:EPY23180.1 hypothetical protein AGDE_12997 [Angomonas deanei]
MQNNRGERRVCRNYQDGHCQYGDQCRFSHGGNPARRNDPPNRAERGVCRYFQNGTCRNGSECPYQHVGQENRRDGRARPAAGNATDLPPPPRLELKFQAGTEVVPTPSSVEPFSIELKHSADQVRRLRGYEGQLLQKYEATVADRESDGTRLESLLVPEAGVEQFPGTGGCVVAVDPKNAKRLDDAFEFYRLDDGAAILRVHVIDVQSLVAEEHEREARSKLLEFRSTLLPFKCSKRLFSDKDAQALYSFSLKELKPAITVELKLRAGEGLKEVLADPTRFRVFRSRVRLTARVAQEDDVFKNGCNTTVAENDNDGIKAVKQVYQCILPVLEARGRAEAIRATETMEPRFNNNTIKLVYTPTRHEPRVLTNFLLKSVFGAGLRPVLVNHPHRECIPCLLPFGQCKPLFEDNDLLCRTLVPRYVPEELKPKTLSYVDDYLLMKAGVGLVEFVQLAFPNLHKECFKMEGTYTTLKEAEEHGWDYSCVVNKPAREYMSLMLTEIAMNHLEGKGCRWSEEPSVVSRLIKDVNAITKVLSGVDRLNSSLIRVLFAEQQAIRDGSCCLVPGFSIKKENGRFDIFLPQMDHTIRDVPSKGLRDGGKLWLSVNPCSGMATSVTLRAA